MIGTTTHGAPGGAAAPAPAKDKPLSPSQVIGICDAFKNALSILRSSHRLNALKASELEFNDMATELQSLSRCALEMAEEFKQSARRLLGEGRR